MTARPAGPHLQVTLDNPRADRVKQVAALAGRSARHKYARMLVDGPQAVTSAVQSVPDRVRDVYLSETALAKHGALADAAIAAGLHVHGASDEVVAAMSRDAQGVVAVVDTPDTSLADVPVGARIVAILSNVRDPGNAGTVIRTADAAGASAVILAGDCVDPANPKVIRASAGSVFHLPVIMGVTLAEAVAAAHDAGLAVVATDVSGRVVLGSAQAAAIVGAPAAWLFGNEAWGLDPDELAMADHAVSIPIAGGAESLNLAAAAAVCLYASALAEH